MASLSAGQISALIAAGTNALQLLLPLAIPLILIAFINKRHNEVHETAVTWSVLSRALQSTYWPTVLKADSTATTGVNPMVASAVYLGIFATLLITTTAVITPLGLYDATGPKKAQKTFFSYAPDKTSFGYGTLPRNDMGFNRICGAGTLPCPGSNFSVIRTDNPDNLTYRTEWPTGYYTNISLDTQNIWSSGLAAMEGSVSSIFDIQWRSYEIRQQNLSSYLNGSNYASPVPGKYYDGGSPFAVGGYRHIQSLLPGDGIKLIEGLVVDTSGGGIGFRNHTIPLQTSLGSTWTEDILFIIPETKCVDNNITIDYDLKEDPSLHVLKPGGILRLTDHGGFANLNRTVNVKSMEMNSSQDSVHLHDRALFAAWYSNGYTMLYMNLTNYTLIKEWKAYEGAKINASYLLLDEPNSTTTYSHLAGVLPKPGRIAVDRLGKHLDLPLFNDTAPLNPNRLFPNPHQVTSKDLSGLERFVHGRVDDFPSTNVSNVAYMSGTLYPPPRPLGRDPDPFDRGKPGEAWSQSMYTCVSASRATIKTTTFLYNGTGGLSDLHVIDAVEKSYQNLSAIPLWGVEDTGFTYRRIRPFWGLLSPEYEGKPNISSIRRESFWLPGDTPASSPVVESMMNIPGASFYTTIMSHIYSNLLNNGLKSTFDDVQDYSGYAQFALYQKWLELGQSASRSAEIINLIWTDMAANAVVGTRSWVSDVPDSVSSRPQGQGRSFELPDVTIFERRTRYHLIYAVPAMLLLLLTLIVSITTILLLLLHRTGVGRMRWFLDQTSLGRNFTSLLYPEVSSQETTRKMWAKHDAQKLVAVAMDRPYASPRSRINTSPARVSQCLIDKKENVHLG